MSVVIPLFNEEAGLAELLRRVGDVLGRLPGSAHEIVLVDDGSRDRTWEMVRAFATSDSRIVGVALSRNFGHQAALSAGLDVARGDVLVLMDADLQDPPEEIPSFLEAWRAGADVVYAQRRSRKENLLLRACYFAFYRLMRWFSSIDLPLDAGDFGLLSRRVVDLLRQMPERHRYLRGLRSWVGFRQVGIPIERAPRFAGESKYSLRRLVRLALDGMLSFSVAPLRAVAVVGAMSIVVSLAYGGWALFVRVSAGATPQGFTSLVLLLIFFGGVQLLSLGVLGEYVGRIYEEVKARPHFIVADVVRATDDLV